jgi:2-polyprenyl-6-methoxyphenol hydroxylase-like FAD-dependent oxidoreductase
VVTGSCPVAGDAAHATSFLSGQGSSVALVGAYMLARELALSTDHVTAFQRYEQAIRDFVTMNQALAHSGKRSLAPGSRLELVRRNLGLRLAPLISFTGLLGRDGRIANSTIEIPPPPN